MTRKKDDKRLIWTIDCETDPFKYARVPEPFIWGIYTGVSYHHMDTVQEVVDFIKDHDVICYAHNGGKFDFHYLLAHINLHEEIKVINGRLVVAKIGKCELRDSWNLLPIPLAQYQKTKVDYSIFEKEERDKPHNRKIIVDYLRDDCVDLWNLVTAFEAKYGRHLTQAGASLAMWKQFSGLEEPKSNTRFFADFSKFYYGGRVQCFRKGHVRGPLQVYDINSAYPWAMLSEHPYATDYVVLDNPKQINPTSMVTLDCVSAGALPWRDEHGSIVFPDDQERRRYYVPGHEILAAMDTNSLSRVAFVQSVEFVGEVSFAGYIRHYYEQRKIAKAAGDKAEDIFCKLLMNSLYGKFAANPDNYGNFMCVPFDEIADHTDGKYAFDGMIGPHALMKAPLEPYQQNFLNVATSASITSQVRAKLWRAIHAAEDPIYCDTDSLVCRGVDLPCTDALGDWKHEGTASDAFIAGKKLYAMRGDFGKDKHSDPITEKKASKGVRLSFDHIKKAALGGVVLPEDAAYQELNPAPTFRLFDKKGKRATFMNRRIRKT